MRHAVIMAGGSGTRLWPLSRGDRPKQLVPFLNHRGRRRSLLEVAGQRLEGLIPVEHRFVCTGERYRSAVRTVLPELGDEQILGEPAGRDTAAAVGFAATVLAKSDPDAIFCVLTADHLIEPVDRFQACLEQGFKLVEEDASRLVTFSIAPTHAATGYGYVERSREIAGTGGRAYRVERFVEKPSLEKAQAYIESGAFGWNSGMFVWSAKTFLDCLRRYKPESHAGLMRIGEAWGTDRERAVLDEAYPALPRISVDYAVMEPATREQARTSKGAGEGVKVCTVLMDVSWLDIGSWPSFAQTLDANAEGHRTSGNVIVSGGGGSLIVNIDDRHTIAALGCDDLVIVHTEDATLIMPRDKAEDLKGFQGDLPEKLR